MKVPMKNLPLSVDFIDMKVFIFEQQIDKIDKADTYLNDLVVGLLVDVTVAALAGDGPGHDDPVLAQLTTKFSQ